MSPDAKDHNTNKEESGEHAQALLLVNTFPFLQIAKNNDYTLYQAQKQRQVGNIKVDIFLEQVSDKGWWGAMRLNGRFRIQLRLDHNTLFPASEIALLGRESLSSKKSALCPLH